MISSVKETELVRRSFQYRGLASFWNLIYNKVKFNNANKDDFHVDQKIFSNSLLTMKHHDL